jgi:hypothetical protein
MTINPDEFIMVPVAKYEEMKRLIDKLDALESWGVDNWEGYDNAMQELHKDDDE